jgi:hypothetical protein
MLTSRPMSGCSAWRLASTVACGRRSAGPNHGFASAAAHHADDLDALCVAAGGPMARRRPVPPSVARLHGVGYGSHVTWR